jgi:3-hydroxyacyl-CoA dehydrogenase
MASITPTTTLDGFDSVDIVTEAVSEDLETKTSVFADIQRATRADCLLASSTSTLDVDELGRASSRPGCVIGHHFVVVGGGRGIKVIEIIRGRETSREAIATSLKLSKRLGKIGVVFGNCGGVVAHRLLAAYLREAYLLQAEGAFAPQIDRALTRFGLAVGPFAVEHIAGIDVPRIRQETAHRVEPRALTDEAIVERIAGAIANEGARVLAEGCASRSGDLDILCCYAFGFPRARGGPMYYVESQRRKSNTGADFEPLRLSPGTSAS